MNQNTQTLLIILILISFAGGEFLFKRFYQGHKLTSDDWTLDLVGLTLLAIFTQPFILWVTYKLGLNFFPAYQNKLADIPWYYALLLFLVLDDMMQYWWHRASHSPLLWPLHRAHHSAQYMSAIMIYRNNFFYYLTMPAIWFSGALVYLGLGKFYLVYIVIKLTVITGAHSNMRWDEPLHKIKALKPIMWVVQRTISTPTTHFAHHAMTNLDGIGYYTGNYGNLLFFWDILFGSAHITTQYPAKVGLKDDQIWGAEKWYQELFYPLFWSKRPNSALTPGGMPYDGDAGK